MATRERTFLGDRDTAWAGFLALALFAVYAAGASRTIYVGDSGELVTAVHLLGVPHPTGYPLYVMLGKLWTLLVPVGSIAFRMSLFSAACAAAAAAVLYRMCRSLQLHPIAALVAALLLAFCPSFWGEANIQRVYALNALFVALATTAAVGWYRRRKPALLVLTFFLCGLGAANHTFMAAYALAFGSFALFVEPRALLRPRQVAAAAGAMAIGLLPYIYLPLASRADPRLDWGDPETLGRFLDVVLRRDFWNRAWIESPADTAVIAADYLQGLGIELAWVGGALAALGLLAGWRRRWPVLLAVLVMVANFAVMAVHGSRSDLFIWHRYYVPSYAMAALLAGFGCQVLAERLPRPLRVLPLAVPAFLLVSGWQAFDRGRYSIAEDFSRAVLRSIPPGSSLIATDDNILFVLIYLTMVENLRPDVNLILQGVGSADLPRLRFDPETDPLYFTHHPNWNLPALDIVPTGLVFRAWRSGQPPPEPVVPLWELPGAADPRVPKDYLTQNLIGQFHYMLGVTFEQRDWLRARRSFDDAAAAAPHNDVLFYNIGLIYQRNGLLDDAIAAFERSREINPRHIASSSQVRASDRLRELTVERCRIAKVEAALANDPGLRAEPPYTAAYHQRLAELLQERGESVAARGRRLQALERAVGF